MLHNYNIMNPTGKYIVVWYTNEINVEQLKLFLPRLPIYVITITKNIDITPISPSYCKDINARNIFLNIVHNELNGVSYDIRNAGFISLCQNADILYYLPSEDHHEVLTLRNKMNRRSINIAELFPNIGNKS
jgi:hypothetical protein